MIRTVHFADETYTIVYVSVSLKFSMNLDYLFIFGKKSTNETVYGNLGRSIIDLENDSGFNQLISCILIIYVIN